MARVFVSFATPDLPVARHPLLAQSGVDWLVATSYQLLIEGESHRRRQRPTHASTGVS